MRQLEIALVPHGYGDRMGSEFYKSEQIPGQTTDEYYEKLSNLAMFAFSEKSEAERKSLVIDRFKRGINPKISHMIANVTDPDNVIIMAREHESMLKRCEMYEQNKSSMKYGCSNTEAQILPVQHQKGFNRPYNSSQKSYNYRDGRQQNFQEKPRQYKPAYNSESSTKAPGKDAECFYCHKRGHFIKDCRKRIRNNETQNRQRTFTRGTHLINSTNTTFNNKQQQSSEVTYRDDGSDTDVTNLAHFLDDKSVKTVRFVLPICSQKVSVFVDSGSSLSLVSQKYVMQLPGNIPLSACNINSNSATFERIPIFAKASLTLNVNGQLIPHTFVVARKLPFPCILGNDIFVKLNPLCIDYIKKTVSLAHVSFPFDEYCKQQDQLHTLICFTEPKRIPAFTDFVGFGRPCETLMSNNVIVDECLSPIRATTVDSFQNWDNFSGENISVEPSLSLVRRGKIPIKIMNNNSFEIEIPANTPVATAEVIDSSKVRTANFRSEEDIVLSATSASDIKAIPKDKLQSQQSESDKQKLIQQLDESVRKSKCSVPFQARLSDMFQRNLSTFALNDLELGRTNIVKHKVDTQGHDPIYQRPRRNTHSSRAIEEEHINKMLTQGAIIPSCSPWSSPVVIVPKKDGSLRFCIDFRRLNAITKKDKYPIPRIDDTLDLLGSAKVMSSLDLQSGYWQIEMDPNDAEKTSFSSFMGQFSWRVMPFGLSNAPATFQRCMEQILRPVLRRFAVVYIDDILIYSRNMEEHLDHLEQIFTLLREAGLKLKFRKCSFCQTQVLYLGYLISANGLQPDPSKIKAVVEYSKPTSVKELRCFLGLTSYYRRFIYCYAKVAFPLNELLKEKNQFIWGKDQDTAFETLKKRLTSAPILAFPDFSRPFVITTDACTTGLGAILQNEGSKQVIAFASRAIRPNEVKYGITELEALGVIYAILTFRPYVYGYHFKLFTDHRALVWLMKSEQNNARLARWALLLQSYDFEIIYHSGKQNTCADALSRSFETSSATTNTTVKSPSEQCFATALIPNDLSVTRLKREQLTDEFCSPMIQYIQQKLLPHDTKTARRIVLQSEQFIYEDGLLY